MANSEKIKIPVFENQTSYKSKVKINEVRKYEVDFTAWAEDHADILTVTWTQKRGSVSIDSEALVSDVATAILTFTSLGRSLIEIKAVTSAETKIVFLDLWVDDISLDFVNDYSRC